jgi:hypothetical protein
MIILASLAGEPVYIDVRDLTAFVHAEPDATVCVYDTHSNAITARKKDLCDLVPETPEYQDHGTPPHDAATATGMYDHD